MANTSLRVTELDYNNIRENLKTFLRNQNEFTDYDFDGSGMSVLLDILAYNTHYMGYYLNMVANEMFLDTAQLRNSVISHAKLINYVPTSRQGAQARVNITVTPSVEEDQAATTLTLEKYTRLLGEDIDGVNFNFVTINSNSSVKVANTFTFSNVVIRQGEVITRQYLMDYATNPNRRFTIPSANVDLSTVTVAVQQSTSNTDTKVYTLSEDLTTVYANSKVYFAEEDIDRKYVIYFGDNYIGKKPDDQSVIILTYLESAGSSANGISRFRFVEPIGGQYTDNVSVSTVTSARDGAERESLQEVKFHAPHFYTAQNRMVTKNDFETLLMQDYQNITSVSVWGGEDNDPPIYGKVFISIQTDGNYVITDIEKENIKTELIRNRSILTVTPEIVDPNYVYLLITGDVTYDPTKTNKTANELQTLINAAIADYANDNLETFNSTYRKSKLQSYIEDADESITGSDITVMLQNRINLETDEIKTYVVDFNMPIKRAYFENQIYTFPQINVIDSSGVTRAVFFEETPQSFTGIDSISVVNPGINYDTVPTVTITGDGTGATATARVVNGRVQSITLTNRGINYTRATISITGGGGSQATAIAVLQAKTGTLRTYYYRANGEKVVLNAAAGTINYDTGRITIDSLSTTGTVSNNLYDDNVLTINVLPENEIIRPQRNRIVTIDETNRNAIVLNVVAE